MNDAERIKDLERNNELLTQIVKARNGSDNPLHVKIGELTAEIRNLKKQLNDLRNRVNAYVA